jgi:arylsulfatase A-like enzyme
MSKYRIKFSIYAVLPLLLLICGCNPPKEPQPNVIWIVLDALRAHNLSCYGYERPTSPNIDKLANEGVLFEDNFTQGMFTAISVPSYMTGRYFPVFSHEPAVGYEVSREPPPGEYLLPAIMKGNGYETALITSHAWFSPDSRLYKSFDEGIIVKPAKGQAVHYAPFEEVNSVVFSWLTKPHDRPFFLHVHVMDTHFPHVLDPPYDKWLLEGYTGDQVKDGRVVKLGRAGFSDTDKEQLRGLYDGGILYADAQVGALIHKLEELDLLEKTVIIISSDHGELLGEDGWRCGHGEASDDWQMQVPLVMAGPGLPRGVRVSALTENADIVPTLIELLGLKTDAGADGKSLLPLLDGSPAEPLHRYVFARYASGGYDGTTCYIIRDKQYKYEYTPDLNTEHLYRVPDTVPKREDLREVNPEIVAAMRQYAEDNLVPLQEQYDNLPSKAFHFSLRRIAQDVVEPKEAVLFEGAALTTDEPVDDRTDNRWSFSRSLTALWASWEEDAPPVTLRLEVPNGSYLAYMYVLSCSAYLQRKPASAFLVKAENDKEFKRVEEASRRPENLGFEFVSIGEYEIEDGSFDVTLDDADEEHWAIVKRFVLIPRSEERSVDEERLRRLRDLGYAK